MRNTVAYLDMIDIWDFIQHFFIGLSKIYGGINASIYI